MNKFILKLKSKSYKIFMYEIEEDTKKIETHPIFIDNKHHHC